ncbi:MAG: inositol monophosphatase family protein [Candidatus Bathyarchaeia archaeon]
MTSWLSILEACSQKMKKEILALLGSVEAKAGFGIGAGGDVIRKIDLAAENALIQTLQDYRVSCTLISEEAGTKEIGSNPSSFYLVTDPLDGTTNAVRGAPFMAISLAVSKRPYLRDLETALVCDPVHDVTYTAERGKGAFRNREGIQPSLTTSLEEAVMGVDFNTLKIRELMPRLIPLLEKTKHLRHFGADALELCYVADGTTDAFIDIRGKLRVTDIAAAYLILREAGGIMVTPEGNKLEVGLDATQRVAFIAAANKTFYAKIQKLLK